jgi:hypothetical protein
VPFIPNVPCFWDEFCNQIRVITEKIIYDNFNMKTSKLKKRMPSGSCLTSKLYDKIIKMLSKSHKTIPLSAEKFAANKKAVGKENYL